MNAIKGQRWELYQKGVFHFIGEVLAPDRQGLRYQVVQVYPDNASSYGVGKIISYGGDRFTSECWKYLEGQDACIQ